MLRAGLSRCAHLRPFILGNPKAWLGTAYHKVMEQLPTILAASEPLATTDAIWNAEIVRLEQEAANHPLNARFGSARSWKGYYLVQATVRLRIEEALVGASTTQPLASAPRSTVREVDITAAQGKLRGKIDLIHGDDLIDYKTGSIFEEDEIGGEPAVKQVYIRQLRIYAWLAHADSPDGRWVKRALLYPLAGAPVEIPIVPAECEAEATTAIALLDTYNDALAAGTSLTTLANPSPEACRWCPFKSFCPTFWTVINPDWTGQLDGGVIRGTLVAPPQALMLQDAYSLDVSVQQGTVQPGTLVHLAPLPAQIHQALPALAAGQPVVLTRVGQRANGSPFPILETVLLTQDQVNIVWQGQPAAG